MKSLRCLLQATLATVFAIPALAGAETPEELMENLSELPYVEVADVQAGTKVRGHLVALGAMQKVRGAWQPRESERANGVLSRFTWRALDLYPSIQLMNDLIEELSDAFPAELLYSCDARACGSSAQWANRIFNQRVLYGRESEQRYRVFRVNVIGISYRIMLYATARSADRQYLHAEVLQLASDSTP